MKKFVILSRLVAAAVLYWVHVVCRQSTWIHVVARARWTCWPLYCLWRRHFIMNSRRSRRFVFVAVAQWLTSITWNPVDAGSIPAGACFSKNWTHGVFGVLEFYMLACVQIPVRYCRSRKVPGIWTWALHWIRVLCGRRVPTDLHSQKSGGQSDGQVLSIRILGSPPGNNLNN